MYLSLVNSTFILVFIKPRIHLTDSEERLRLKSTRGGINSLRGGPTKKRKRGKESVEAEHAEGTTSLFRSGGRPANPFRVVSSRATSWRLRVIHHGVSTSVPAAVISHPSTPPQDERTSVLTTFPWSMSTVLEATSKPHLRPVLPISPPLQQFSLSLSFSLPFFNPSIKRKKNKFQERKYDRNSLCFSVQEQTRWRTWWSCMDNTWSLQSRLTRTSFVRFIRDRGIHDFFVL